MSKSFRDTCGTKGCERRAHLSDKSCWVCKNAVLDSTVVPFVTAETTTKVALHLKIKEPIYLTGEQYDLLRNEGWDVFSAMWRITYRERRFWRFWKKGGWYFRHHSVEDELQEMMAKEIAEKLEAETMKQFINAGSP